MKIKLLFETCYEFHSRLLLVYSNKLLKTRLTSERKECLPVQRRKVVIDKNQLCIQFLRIFTPLRYRVRILDKSCSNARYSEAQVYTYHSRIGYTRTENCEYGRTIHGVFHHRVPFLVTSELLGSEAVPFNSADSSNLISL